MYEIKQIFKNGEMFQLDKGGKVQWCFVGSKLKNFVKNYKVGDVVEAKITTKDEFNPGKPTILFMKKVTNQPTQTDLPPDYDESPTQPTPSVAVDRPPFIPQTSSINTFSSGGGDFQKKKDPEESEQILKLSVASSASQALQSLAGMLDPNTVIQTWNELFDNIYQKVKS